MKLPRIVGIGVLLFAGAPGCATVVGGWRDQEVKITSEPPGATVLVDGQPVGSTPTMVPLSRKTEHQIDITQPGYSHAHFTLRRQLNPWVFGNVLIGGIVGAVVDVCTDATHTLTPDDIRVTLTPATTSAIQQTGK